MNYIPGPYAGYSDEQLERTHSIWLHVRMSPLNEPQRVRAARNVAAVEAEIKRREEAKS